MYDRPTQYRRSIEQKYREAIAARRVTVLSGPRQTGKTTLVSDLVKQGTLRNLDEQQILDAALSDPIHFIEAGERPLVIDEVQRGGEELVRAIKTAVDRSQRPGQFVLTGSASFLTVPVIAESLAGRASFLDIWPLTQGERIGIRSCFPDLLFAGPEAFMHRPVEATYRPEMLARVCTGGFPEAIQLSEANRNQWFDDYVRATIQRDIVELTGIRKVQELYRLLRLFAARTACELVMQDLIADSALARQAVYDYRSWLESIHLVTTVPAFSPNQTNRARRRPKVFITDTGLCAWLLGRSPSALNEPGERATGQLVESFVYGELRSQLTWSETDANIFHWRERSGLEVDLVLESNSGAVAALEVKASATVRRSHFKSLEALRERLGDRFRIGVVLHAGREVLSFGDRLLAMPLSALWSFGEPLIETDH